MPHRQPRTSVSHPLRVDFVDTAALPAGARLGLTFAPGKQQRNAQTGIWDRDLAADLQRLRDPLAVDVLVSLTEEHEHRQLGIPDLPRAVRDAGMEHLHFPIRDQGVPEDRRAFRQLVERVAWRLRQGRTVVVHCKGGLGRSGMAAAAASVLLGEKPRRAIERVLSLRRAFRLRRSLDRPET